MRNPDKLEMMRPWLDDLPDLAVPGECRVRSFRPGDETHWVRIMNRSIGSGWTEERFRTGLLEQPQFLPEGCFFVDVGGVPAATATAWYRPERHPQRDVGNLHMVGVDPDYRGRGLGRLVSLAALHWFRAQGFRSVFLITDDWRLPAIALYLQLGFEPVPFVEEHEFRWKEVHARLAGIEPTTPDAASTTSADRSPGPLPTA